jgi:hypothetical protein
MKTIFIPMCPYIMSEKGLDLLDKLVLSYVKNWESKGLPCFAKNSLLGQLFGESEDAISLSIAKLGAMKKLRITSVPGGRLIQYEIPIPVSTEDVDLFQI